MDGKLPPLSSNGFDETPKLCPVKISISRLVLSAESTMFSQEDFDSFRLAL